MKKERPLLFSDSLKGASGPGWLHPPRDFRDVPGHGRRYLLDTATRRKRHPLPAVGDETWSQYRVEFEFMPKSSKGYTGLNFHVQPNGDACNFHFPSGCSGRNEAFQSMSIFGKSMAWQLYPESQGYAIFRQDDWSQVRLDVGSTCANLFVNGGPVLAMFDLPFSNGGIQFWSLASQVFIRQLRVTDLLGSRVVPFFRNPWLVYADANVLDDWSAALADEDGAVDAACALDEVALNRLEWLPAHADRRGVVNLSKTFTGYNTKAAAYAATSIIADDATRATLCLTYTDELTLWCNGKLVFTGEPRGWNAPDREAHFGGRLMPDEYAVALRLREGQNTLLARTKVVDPWGWGFWMRLQCGPERAGANIQ